MISRILQEVRTLLFELKVILHFVLNCRDISSSKILSSFHPHTNCETEWDWGQGGYMKKGDFTSGRLKANS